MSNLKAEISIDWADGTYLFRLPVNQLLELEQKCDAPFATVYRRLATGAYSVTDLRETLRLGLIGGGAEPVKALQLLRNYFDDRPKAEALPVARAVLGAALFGFEVDDLGNQEAAMEESQSASSPPTSTPPPRPSAGSPLRTSTASRFGNGQQP
ncbi:gene transfer agent family protein [Hyphomicrobium sp. CS1GBMeth3]|uniref:gene transfer agent family protein n=1 Tax=Hyphomicrobium sp. CS1GBMeth3 TaxID=1892845 RepID=UPI000930D9D4|nr:gene transfer agent family protein [Hyphomicrobium sp. CS1GBMeth3]